MSIGGRQAGEGAAQDIRNACDNDFTAAAKALAAEGYGDKPPQHGEFGDGWAEGGTPDTTPKLTVTSLESVDREEVIPLWPKRIFKGKLTIVAGDPGLGKSFSSLDIAAKVSLAVPGRMALATLLWATYSSYRLKMGWPTPSSQDLNSWAPT